MAKIIGSVDDLGRPVVRIEVPGRDGTAQALIGTEMLADCLLLVDFRTRIVEIEEQH